MKYHSVADTAKLWNISERTVRNYCATGKIPGAVLTGKTWNIPQDAKRPARTNKKPKAPRTLLDILQNEMTGQVKGGIYHKIQIDLTYNSNHIEGSRLTHDQTRYIYETNTIGMENGVVNVDDVVETANHFKCIDLVIRDAKLCIPDDKVNALEVIGRFDYIIYIDNTVLHANGIGLVDIPCLVVGQAAALNMVGVIGQVDLDFVVDAALDLPGHLVLQNIQQGSGCFRLFVGARRALCILRNIPSLAGKHCTRNLAGSTVVADSSL